MAPSARRSSRLRAIAARPRPRRRWSGWVARVSSMPRTEPSRSVSTLFERAVTGWDAVEGDHHQVATEAGILDPLLDPVVGALPLAPVLAERGDGHLVDRPQLARLGRPEHVALGDDHGRQVLHVRPQHLGVPADRRVAEASRGPWLELRVAAEHVVGQVRAPARGVLEGDLAGADLAPADHRLHEPEAPGGRLEDRWSGRRPGRHRPGRATRPGRTRGRPRPARRGCSRVAASEFTRWV